MATIHYARTDEFWRKEQKYDFLEQHEHVGRIDWQVVAPDKHHLWLTEGMHDEFETLLPIGAQETKAGLEQTAIFELYSNGVKSNRDTWVYNYSQEQLATNIQRLIVAYNDELARWQRTSPKPKIDDFVANDSSYISWSEGLKTYLQRHIVISYDSVRLRKSFYRPFTQIYLYFDKQLNERRYQIPVIFPTPQAEKDNRVIWVKTGSEWPTFGLIVNRIPDLMPQGGTQCFPFYTYDEDGSNRRENITDWALEQFRARYTDPAAQDHSTLHTPHSALEKWDIFHYVYALLHHPEYRSKYAANLRRELPRIPFVQDFWNFAQAGARLAEIHVNYEKQPEYRLNFIENADKPLNWRVEKLKLSKDKHSLIYNDFLTLDGIPPQVFDYKLGNRSALDWIIDQYQVGVDTRSGITNDPNNADDPQAIVRLIGQVITVSLETVQIVNSLPTLENLE